MKSKINSYVDIFLALSLISVYVLFRFKIITDNIADYYFIFSSLTMAWFIRKAANSHTKKGFYLVLIYASFTFYGMVFLFLWYWVVLGDPAIWVYKSLLIGVLLSGIHELLKHYKNGIITYFKSIREHKRFSVNN